MEGGIEEVEVGEEGGGGKVTFFQLPVHVGSSILLNL